MAVYTEVTDAALRAHLAGYGLGGLLSFHGIAEGVENSNFALSTEAGEFILTLYEKRVDAAELPWFLGLMQHLAAQGLACPEPVAARNGTALGELAGRPAAICTFLPGAWPRTVEVAHCGPLGDVLAALHLAGASYAPTRRNALGPAAWAPLLDRCRADAAPSLVAELDRALPAILSAWPHAGLPTGHIHADLFPDNVFFLGEPPRVSGVIDFYFACTDLLAYDLAVCLNAWCFSAERGFDMARARAMVAAYAARRPLSPEERAALPVLCQGAALRFLLTRLFDWVNTPAGAMVTRKDPMEYLHKLRFFRQAAGPEAIGA